RCSGPRAGFLLVVSIESERGRVRLIGPALNTRGLSVKMPNVHRGVVDSTRISDCRGPPRQSSVPPRLAWGPLSGTPPAPRLYPSRCGCSQGAWIWLSGLTVLVAFYTLETGGESAYRPENVNEMVFLPIHVANPDEAPSC